MSKLDDEPEMDHFAQTRAADDLFESEIQVSTPLPPPPIPIPLPLPPTTPTTSTTSTTRVNIIKKGGGRGKGGEQQHHHNHQFRERTNPPSDNVQNEVKEPSIADEAATGATAATSANKVDRTLSGGVKKPKLSDEELAQRMERVRLNNQLLTERRRKAEEDENLFHVLEAERKQLDSARRLQERKKKVEAEKNRRELVEEREKNRQRKLKAVQNREWDSRKTEEDYNPKAYNPRFRRGAYGGVTARSTRQIPVGDTNPGVVSDTTKSEWPNLPGNDAPKKEESADARTEDISKLALNQSSLPTGAGTWADQMEADASAVKHGTTIESPKP